MAYLTHLSTHARYRIEHRTRLTNAQIISLLERKKYIDIGTEACSNRVHLLFYSKVDDAYFIAVRDRIYGTVSTLLPLEFHATLAWPVKQEDLESAKAIAEDEVPQLTVEKEPPPKLPRNLHVSIYTEKAGKTTLANGLSKFVTEYSCVEEAAEDLKQLKLIPDLREQAEAVGIKWNAVEGIVLKLGNRGRTIWVRASDIYAKV